MTAVTLDYFMVATSDDDAMERFNSMLQSKYKIKRMGFPTTFLNWTITRGDEDTIHISQPAPIKALLEQTKMQDCRPKPTHLPPKPDFDEDFESSALDKQQTKEYQAILASLRYLSDSTRLDIAFSISKMAKFGHKPTRKHYELVKHIIRYLKGSIDYGIL